MRSYKLLPPTVLLFFLFSTACHKKLEIIPSSAVSSFNMWKTYEDARAGLTGMYGLARAAMANNNGHWVYGDLRLGDFKASRTGTYVEAVINNELNKSFSELEELSDWRRFYAAIDACNTFIENASNCTIDPRYSTLNSKVDIAQAHVLRAYLYFYISRIWGDVPLVTKASSYGALKPSARTPQREVLNFCVQDIKNYLDSLPTEYGNNDRSVLNYDGLYYGKNWSQIGNTYWGYWQAIAILAQIYGWMGDYDNCGIYTNMIISNVGETGTSNGVNTRVIDYNTVTADLSGPQSIFYGTGVKGGNCFQLLSLPYNMENRESGPSGIGHIESLTLGSPFLPKLVPDIYIPRESIDKLFYSLSDKRHPYDNTIKNYGSVYFTNYYDAIPIFSKFKTIAPGATGFSIFGSCIPLSRYEDILLLDAEVNYKKNLTGNAVKRMEIIRKFRWTNGYSANLRPTGQDVPVFMPTERSQENGLLWNIFRERRIELAGEGMSWYDLVRYKKLVGDDPSFNKLINEGGIYWPVSKKVIANNPLIEQNPFWTK